MHVLVLAKGNFSIKEMLAVSSITLSGSNYVIVDNGVTYTYTVADHYIQILW